MTPTLSTEVRRLLGGSKLIALRAPANAAIGERRSKAIGPGIEFAQYRDYEPGDDLRYIDRHVYARLGRVVIRQFNVEQRLRVSVLLDASASMALDPASWRRAVELAAVFGEVTLNGGDQVRFGVARGDRVTWGPIATRGPQLQRELARLASLEPGGAIGSLAEVALRSLEPLGRPGVLVVVSDWLVEGFAEALKTWRVRGQEVVAVQVLGAAEAGRSRSETGWVQLVDVETGEVVERRLDAQAWSLYAREVEAWSEEVRAAVWAAEGRWCRVASDVPLDEAAIQAFRRQGLIT
jgi:uncharacterized protein (DUF58 family)